MKKLFVIGLMAAGIFCGSTNANAQLGGLLKKAAKGVVDKAKKTVTDAAESTVNSATNGAASAVTGGATGTTQTVTPQAFVGGLGFGAVAESYTEQEKPEVPKDEMQMDKVEIGMTDASLISSLGEHLKGVEFFTKHPNRKFLRAVIETKNWEYKRNNLGGYPRTNG